MKYDFIFVVLVYRNTQDLADFFLSNRITSSKVIVVNSFYDDITEKQFAHIAAANEADFISVPNRGYGAGNNIGCQYALDNYDFRYLIISNADIIIKALSMDEVQKYGESILAPKIITLRGKNQNPFWPYRIPKIELAILYWLNKKNHAKITLFMCIFSKIRKVVFNLIYNITKHRCIWAAHGAFVILEKSVLQKLFPLYNEQMFLFGEEGHLCKKAERYNVKTYYVPEIEVQHKEDGSVGFVNDKLYEMGRQSYMIFYDYWFKK